MCRLIAMSDLQRGTTHSSRWPLLQRRSPPVTPFPASASCTRPTPVFSQAVRLWEEADTGKTLPSSSQLLILFTALLQRVLRLIHRNHHSTHMLGQRLQPPAQQCLLWPTVPRVSINSEGVGSVGDSSSSPVCSLMLTSLICCVFRPLLFQVPILYKCSSPTSHQQSIISKYYVSICVQVPMQSKQE